MVDVLLPEPTAWKPPVGAAPVELLPEPTAWKPPAGTTGTLEDWWNKLTTNLSEVGWNALGWAGAAATYGTLGYLIYHNWRIGARLHDIDMWAKSLKGRIPSGDEIVANSYIPIGEVAAVLFFGDDDYLSDRDDWDVGITLTPASRTYQAMHLANTRLKDFGISLDPIEYGDPPPSLQKPPVRILSHDDVAHLFDKASEYQAIERVREGDFFDNLLQG